jgi:carboxyl-terminal processing protease
MGRQRILLTATVIISLAVGFGSGFLFFKHQNQKAVDGIITSVVNREDGKDSAVDFSLFWQVWDRLQQRYVDKTKLDAQKLVYGAISGMVDAVGDPYTTFFEPVTSKKFQEEVNGAFSGVGMEIGKQNGVITVIAPIKDSPALKAGIKAQDVVVKIDTKSTEGMSVEEAVNLIRGKKGTTVHLTVIRTGEDAPLEFTLTRDVIRVPAVDWKLIDGHVAYMQIYSFNANVDDEFIRAAKEITASSADRLIIDMRNNPGGLLDSSVNLAGWMLNPGSVVVQEKFSDGSIEQLRADGNARLAKYPTIVLINGGSASASEILAGALHDIRNLQLIGEKSFGKGSVQQLESFYNGSSLKVTIAKWLTPNGVSISDAGIAPTTEVKIDPKDYKEGKIEFGTPAKDPQLTKALEIVGGLR